jgi:Flp pilus assembly protein TadB
MHSVLNPLLSLATATLFTLTLTPRMRMSVERKRREYLAALQQQQERHAYERAVAAGEERRRARLAALAEQERMRRHATHPRSPPPRMPLDAMVHLTLLLTLFAVAIIVHVRPLNATHSRQHPFLHAAGQSGRQV